MVEHESRAELGGFEPKLNDRDRELILEQCRLQSAESPAEIAAMTAIFSDAKRFAYEHRHVPLDAAELADKVLDWGRQVDPRNAYGLRIVDVSFADGSHGVSPDVIPQALASWTEAVVDERLTPTEGYREFELIHPYQDGNGREGHCVWAVMETRASGAWPTHLPPDVFGADQQPPVPGSAFGHVEDDQAR